jgi:hypothetical protein
VDAGGAGLQRHLDAVVHDEQHAALAAAGRQLAGEGQEVAVGVLRGAELDRVGAALDRGGGDLGVAPAGHQPGGGDHVHAEDQLGPPHVARHRRHVRLPSGRVPVRPTTYQVGVDGRDRGRRPPWLPGTSSLILSEMSGR